MNIAFRFFAEPCFLEEKDPVNNIIVKATVIYLPDMSNPQYMIIKDGLGSRKVGLKLTNGSINTLAVSTDPKIAESIAANSKRAPKSTNRHIKIDE